MGFDTGLLVVAGLWSIIGASASKRIYDPYKAAVAAFGGQLILCTGLVAEGERFNGPVQFLIAFLLPAGVAQIALLAGYLLGKSVHSARATKDDDSEFR